MAFSAVVLPAPFGPMMPRMRPSSTRRLMPSSATVVPNDLRRPRASIQAIASALLFFRIRPGCGIRFGKIRVGGFRWRGIRGATVAVQQFFRLEAEPLNGFVDSGPVFGKKFLAFALQQQAARAGIDEHAKAAPGLDQPFIHPLLIALKDRKRINAI